MFTKEVELKWIDRTVEPSVIVRQGRSTKIMKRRIALNIHDRKIRPSLDKQRHDVPMAGDGGLVQRRPTVVIDRGHVQHFLQAITIVHIIVHVKQSPKSQKQGAGTIVVTTKVRRSKGSERVRAGDIREEKSEDRERSEEKRGGWTHGENCSGRASV